MLLVLLSEIDDNVKMQGEESVPLTKLVHNGAMDTVRQSISLPTNIAGQVRKLAKTRRVSANRMIIELIENGMEAERRKQEEFFELAERFRAASDPEDVKRLGDQMGRMVFGE